MFKPYERYKPSGVEWLSNVPEHWWVTRLKMAVQLTDRKVAADEEHPAPYIGMENIESRTGRLLPINPDVIPTGTANAFKAGNTLFGKLRPYLAKVCNPDFDGLCSTELLVLKSADINRRVLLYSLLCDGFIKLVDSSTYGSKMPRASWEFVGDCVVPIAPPNEQRTIADFLDRETAKIDTLVAKKRTLIERLKEKRTALISRTVTRGLPPDAARSVGLDPHPKLKPSGIDWLGDVPEHWGVKPLGYLVRFQGGGTPDKGKSEYWDGDIPWVSPKDMKRPRIADAEDHISVDGLENSPLSMVPVGAVLVVVRGMILAHSFPVAMSEMTLTINQDMKALVCCQRILPLFLYWVLVGLSRALVSLCEESAHGTRKLETATLAKFRLPIPQLNEQNAIADYLDQETEKIDQMIAKVEAAIERLQEYRTALITAAVTGKIDVRGIAA